MREPEQPYLVEPPRLSPTAERAKQIRARVAILDRKLQRLWAEIEAKRTETDGLVRERAALVREYNGPLDPDST